MEEKQNSRNVSIVKDLNGNNIVIINDIIFKGRQNISWNDVEKYLTKYVGQFYTIADSKEVVYIGSNLPDEYAHSEDGKKYLYDIMNIKKETSSLFQS